MTQENWKDINGLEGRYQISDRGRVKKLRQRQITKQGKRIWKERIMSECDNGNGYKQFMYKIDGVRRVLYIHRLVAEHFIENPESKKYVNHKDLDRSNNSVENLEWCTCQENMDHACLNGEHRASSSSGYRGVKRADTVTEKWSARVTHKGIEHYVGTFDTIREAVEARNAYIIQNNLPRKIQVFLEKD